VISTVRGLIEWNPLFPQQSWMSPFWQNTRLLANWNWE